MTATHSLDAGLRLWAVVMDLTGGRSGLGRRARIELREAAIMAIAALTGRGGATLGRLPEATARAMFFGLVAALARTGIDNQQLAAWLDESWADREQARQGRA